MMASEQRSDTSSPQFSTVVPIETPDGSQALRALAAVREAALGMRRAQLAKIVRAVVIASAVVCAIALGRALFTTSPADEPAPGASHVEPQSRDRSPLAQIASSSDVASDRTALDVASGRHGKSHARAHKWNARGGW